MLSWVVYLFIIIVLVLIVAFSYYRNKHIYDSFPTNEEGNRVIYESDFDLETPTLPLPEPDEVGIRRGSQLERVYLHFRVNRYLSKRDYRFLDIKKANGYIYRLRKMGFTITTEKDANGKFLQYKLLCYKLK